VKKLLKERWVVPVATLVLTLSIGSAALAATGSSSTDTSTALTNTVTSGTSTSEAATSTDAAAATAPDPSKPFGDQRSDETPLTGDTLAKVRAAAIAKVGTDATVTVVRAETDADGNAKYEAHMQKSDGTLVTVYVDESFNVVSVEDQAVGGHGCGHAGGPGNGAGSGSTESTSTTSSN
jgi:hypothetical protein